mgnify:CR=1 FL=1
MAGELCRPPGAGPQARAPFHRMNSRPTDLRLRAVLAEKDGQVVDQAVKRLGMVQAPGNGLTYVSVPKEARIAPGQAPRTR